MPGDSFEPFCSPRMSIGTIGEHSEGLLSPNSRGFGSLGCRGTVMSLFVPGRCRLARSGDILKDYCRRTVGASGASDVGDSFEPFCSRRVSIGTIGEHSEGLLSPNSHGFGGLGCRGTVMSLFVPGGCRLARSGNILKDYCRRTVGASGASDAGGQF